MDATKIVVIVLTLLTIGFLVWLEMQSRRNARSAGEPPAGQAPNNEEKRSKD